MADVQLIEGSTKELEQGIHPETDKAIKHFERELVKIRTGRAQASMVEDLRVICYGGSEMSIKELATISTPDARLIVIQPWDKTILADIEKTIMTSDLGVSPVNDGELIRINLPQMSATRRDELVKLLNKKQEDAKVAIRNTRKDFQNLIRDTEKKKELSEDFAKRLQALLQKLIDEAIAKVDSIAKKKEADITTV